MKILKILTRLLAGAVITSGGNSTAIAKECTVYFDPKGDAITFDDLKYISLDEVLNSKFLILTWDMHGYHVNPSFYDSKSSPVDKILAYPDDVQDLYWLFVFLRYQTVVNYFQSNDSDFAPYIGRALQRQNMEDAARQFQSAMDAFGSRYQKFDLSEKTIKHFIIPATQAELDQAFLKKLDAMMGEEAPDGYKKMHLDQRKQDRKLLGGGPEKDTLGYAALYATHSDVLQAKDKLRDFPKPIAIYKALRDDICQNDQLHDWYKNIVQSMTEKDRMNILAENLFLLQDRFGTRENWPSVYRDIFALNLFSAQFSNGGFYQYFDHNPNEVPALLEAFKRLNLQNLEADLQKAKSLFEMVNKLSPNELENGNPLDDFEDKLDFTKILDEVDGAMLKLAKENNILPQ
ncbi:DUF4375 domain-containing protein [Bartonella sp. HY038]|uniref:DMP19 family protein n=1 Tax=Bartonella sp. HY038 TaxID=2759660 RepID=UPI0015F8F5DE|nr:DUF4375 domain-containing protein [Bartonella sp. HY038]